MHSYYSKVWVVYTSGGNSSQTEASSWCINTLVSPPYSELNLKYVSHWPSVVPMGFIKYASVGFLPFSILQSSLYHLFSGIYSQINYLPFGSLFQGQLLEEPKLWQCKYKLSIKNSIKNKKIYFIFGGCAGSLLLCGLFPRCGEWGAAL